MYNQTEKEKAARYDHILSENQRLLVENQKLLLKSAELCEEVQEKDAVILTLQRKLYVLSCAIDFKESDTPKVRGFGQL